MQITNFKDMYIAELQELVSLEGQLADALRRMTEVASHQSLKNAFDASSRGNAGPEETT
jgi:ferritin-like metal-binding protein YciE